MITLLLALLCAQEDLNTLTLVFENMHCDECKFEVEARARKVPGFVSLSFEDATAVVRTAEKAPPPMVGAFPKDLRLKSQTIRIRGTVNASGDKLTLVAKGSGATLGLGGDKLAELKAALGGRNRFRLAGALMGGKMLHVESFQAAEWSD